MQAKDTEHKAIQEGIQQNGVEDSDKVVQAVLAARHAVEDKDIDTEYAALKKLMVDDAIAELHEKYSRKSGELTKKHEEQLKQLQVCSLFNLCLLCQSVLFGFVSLSSTCL